MDGDAFLRLLDKPQSKWRKPELEEAFLLLLRRYQEAMDGWGSALETCEGLAKAARDIALLTNVAGNASVETHPSNGTTVTRLPKLHSDEGLKQSLQFYESIKAEEEKLAGKKLTQTEALRRGTKRLLEQQGKSWLRVSRAFNRKLKSHLNVWSKAKKLSQK
jgi:hypothetical protein